MTRIQHNSWLYHWDAGDNPGAGTKGADSTGLNGQWYKIDVAVLTEHTSAGAHGSNVIHKGNLHTDVADGTTIERDGTNGLQIVAGGVDTTQLATDAVTTIKITDANVTTPKIANLNVTTGKLAADAVDDTKLGDDAVQAEHLSHDNIRTKIPILFSSAAAGAAGYLKFQNVQFTANLGIPFAIAGCITEWRCCGPSGEAYGGTEAAAYSSGVVDRHFEVGDRLQIYDYYPAADSTRAFILRKNGSDITTLARTGPQGPTGTSNYAFMILVELDGADD
jgi:hypothetical protein